MRATTKEAAPLIVLTLSYKEAAWLMKVMQNPLHYETPQDEDHQQAEKRKSLFTSLKGVIG